MTIVPVRRLVSLVGDFMYALRCWPYALPLIDCQFSISESYIERLRIIALSMSEGVWQWHLRNQKIDVCGYY